MQPQSKPKTLAKQMEDDSMMEPPTKVQAMEIPEGESDGEYETVPKKSRKKSPPVPRVPAVVEQPVLPTEPVPDVVADPVEPNATDDDWLRSRTNRLLDLMDPDDMVRPGIGALTSEIVEPVAETSMDIDEPANADDIPAEETFEQEEQEKPNPVIEAIKTKGRLFVRNLPYSASEDDLRQHFEPFGLLDEVRISLSLVSFSFRFMMNIQIGTAYASSM